MNYIKQLEQGRHEANDRIVSLLLRLGAFRQHLDLPKFAKEQADGERGDWISTDDVRRWLRFIETGDN